MGTAFCTGCGATTSPPSSAPTTSPLASNHTSPLQAILTGLELLNAVDSYLNDSSPNSSVAQMYGHPIGTWNVSLVTNFSNVFNVNRNGRAGMFDEDLSGWNTGAAESMDFTFFGAALFNGDVSTWSTGRLTSMTSTCKFLVTSAR